LIQRLKITASAVTFGLVVSLALSSAAVAQQTPPRLLFAQQSGDVCNIRYWYEGALEAVILARTAVCPERLFVDASKRSVFVVDGNDIRTLRIYPLAESAPIPLPDMDHKVWLDKMTPRPDENSNYKPDVGKLQPIGIRFLDDGALGVVLSLGMPADDAYHYLFRHGDDGWSIVAARWCHRWGCEDPEDRAYPFHSENFLSTRGDRSWPEVRMIWHPGLMHSQYVVFRSEEKYEVSPGRYDGSVIKLGLKIDGKPSILETFTSPSEHTDTLHTFNVDLSIDTGPPKNLSKNQCLTSIVGRHILVYEFFRGRFELTDLGTGETVFKDLSTAAWID